MTALVEKSNRTLTEDVVAKLKSIGVQEYILCPGSRNSPFVQQIIADHYRFTTWPEERSAAFFALGRARASRAPVAVCVTSGSAAAELLPAAMEAYYTSVPLVLVTADRPKRFRNTGAPQCAEQTELFVHYSSAQYDIDGSESFSELHWDKKSPLHINIRYEDPMLKTPVANPPVGCTNELGAFLREVDNLLVVVGSLPREEQESVVKFLLQLKAPVYLEGHSGIREDERLADLRITRIDTIWETARSYNYPIQGILRIGGVPVARFWRDLDDTANQIPCFSVSQFPFPGLPHGALAYGVLSEMLANVKEFPKTYVCDNWLAKDRHYAKRGRELLEQFPDSEQGMIYAMSQRIKEGSLIYLGNSLPIREWDLAATPFSRNLEVHSSRGIIGIDGQIATFLGLAQPKRENWALVGDLTFLYDLAAPWVLEQMPDTPVNIVVVNNSGSGLFRKMYSEPEFLNAHSLTFEGIATFWNMCYEQWHHIPDELMDGANRLIELIPNHASTLEFEKQWTSIK